MMANLGQMVIELRDIDAFREVAARLEIAERRLQLLHEYMDDQNDRIGRQNDRIAALERASGGDA